MNTLDGKGTIITNITQGLRDPNPSASAAVEYIFLFFFFFFLLSSTSPVHSAKGEFPVIMSLQP